MTEKKCANCVHYRHWPVEVFKYPDGKSRFAGFRPSEHPRCGAVHYGMYIDDPQEPMPDCVMWRERVTILRDGA